MTLLGSAALALCLLTTACSARDVCNGVYEGVRVRNQLATPPSEQWGKPEPPADYAQYELMRAESLRRDREADTGSSVGR